MMMDQMMNDYATMLQNNTAAANAFNAAQSQKQMDFQVAQNAKAMEFNHREAELNRNWQEMMSNTSHQREVQDLLAAGLNPVLSALGGNGASVGSGSAASISSPSGSKAEADTSLNAGIAGLLSTMISGQTQRDVANINAAASMHNAELTSDATKYAANTNYAGLMQQLAHMEDFPTTMFGLVSSLINGSQLTESLGSILSSWTPDAFANALKGAFSFESPFGSVNGSNPSGSGSSNSGKTSQSLLDKTNKVGKELFDQLKEKINKHTTNKDFAFSRYYKAP